MMPMSASGNIYLRDDSCWVDYSIGTDCSKNPYIGFKPKKYFTFYVMQKIWKGYNITYLGRIHI